MAEAIDIGQELARAGFIVTVDNEVEAAGAAFLLKLSPKTLTNWRNQADGPPYRVRRKLVWYRISDVVAWRSGH